MQATMARFALLLSVLVLLLPTAAAARGGGWVDARVFTLREGVAWHRAQAWHWQSLAGRRHSPTVYSERRETSLPYLRWVVGLWRSRSLAAYHGYKAYQRQFAGLPPHHAGWQCVHYGEGSWWDPSAPYWGGLQMDIAFMIAHGRGLYSRKGTADHWTIAEQMWTAERAVYVDGVNPYRAWPNTYPPCAGKF